MAFNGGFKDRGLSVFLKYQNIIQMSFHKFHALSESFWTDVRINDVDFNPTNTGFRAAKP